LAVVSAIGLSLEMCGDRMVDRTAQSESRDHQSADEHYEGARRVRQDRHGQKARPDPLHRQKPRRAQDEKGQHKLQV